VWPQGKAAVSSSSSSSRRSQMRGLKASFSKQQQQENKNADAWPQGKAAVSSSSSGTQTPGRKAQQQKAAAMKRSNRLLHCAAEQRLVMPQGGAESRGRWWSCSCSHQCLDLRQGSRKQQLQHWRLNEALALACVPMLCRTRADFSTSEEQQGSETLPGTAGLTYWPATVCCVACCIEETNRSPAY
jgi:hypothetical protein